MKDKSFMVLYIIYIIMFAADLLTTLNLGELVQYLEANPLLRVGGLPLIILLNIGAIVVWYWLYKKGTISTRFFVTFYLVAIIMIRIIAISNNLAIAQNPPTIAQAQAVTQQMKTDVVVRQVTTNIFPFFNGIIAWIFFRWDHKIERKNEQTRKSKKKSVKDIKENKTTVLQ